MTELIRRLIRMFWPKPKIKSLPGVRAMKRGLNSVHYYK